MPPYYLLPLPGKASNLTVPKKEGLLPKDTGSGLHEALQLAVRTFSLNRLPVPTCDHQPRDLALFPFPGGMKIMRTWYAADKTGFHMLHTLFPSCRMR